MLLVMVPLTVEHEACVLGYTSSHGDVSALTIPHSCLLYSGLAAPWGKGTERSQGQSHTAKLAGRRG